MKNLLFLKLRFYNRLILSRYIMLFEVLLDFWFSVLTLNPEAVLFKRDVHSMTANNSYITLPWLEV